MKKNDIILLVSVLLIASVCLCLFIAFASDNSDTAVITVNGKEYARLPLDTDTELLIESPNGATNLLKVEDGKAYMCEATCPDKVCVKMGAASELEPIVCLPNNVTVTLEGGR